MSKGQLRQVQTYMVFWELAIDLKFLHPKDDGLCTIDKVLIYDSSAAKKFILCEAVHMYNLYLLHYSRLPKISGP
jgi:hypothetical protein